MSDHEAELDALAAELLDCYEELNVLYDLSAALAGVYDEDELSRIAVAHAVKAIGAASGEVLPGDDVDSALLFEPGATVAKIVTPVPGPDHTPLGALVVLGRPDGQRFDAADMKLAAAVASHLGTSIHTSRLLVSLREAALVQQELEIAASIQRGMLPQRAPAIDGVLVAGRCLPAAQVGGDYFDYVLDDDGRLSIVVADVAGHSLSSALLMATTRSLLRREIREKRGPAEVLAATAESLFADLSRAGLFVTVFCARFDPRTRELRYANGAHNPSLLRLADGTVAELDADGMALGMVEGWPYEEGVRTLERGDLVVLYTDGVTEARNLDGDLYGEPRLHDLVAGVTGAEDAVDAIVDAAVTHSGTNGLQDDLTVLTLEVTG